MHLNDVKNVTIYTTQTCPYCMRAKRLLQKKNIPYEEIDVSWDDDKRMQLMQRTGRRTVPQIFIGDEHVGGSDELYALEQRGELDAKLQEKSSRATALATRTIDAGSRRGGAAATPTNPSSITKRTDLRGGSESRNSSGSISRLAAASAASAGSKPFASSAAAIASAAAAWNTSRPFPANHRPRYVSASVLDSSSSPAAHATASPPRTSPRSGSTSGRRLPRG